VNSAVAAGFGKIASPRRSLRNSYHRGDLREQLLAVAEQLILERGVEGFSLREAARRLAVSPAAPLYHFDSVDTLLTELALLGSRELNDALEQASRAAGPDPVRRLHVRAAAYVRFALTRPVRFQLISRLEPLDRPRVAPEFSDPGLSLLIWSAVVGFANLALTGELRAADGHRADENTVLHCLLPAILAQVTSVVRDMRIGQHTAVRISKEEAAPVHSC